MGSLAEMQKILRQKDDRIRELTKKLQEKDEKILELNSQLDKYQSIIHVQTPTLVTGPRKQRAVGISAEPQAQKQLLAVGNKTFKKYSKTNR